jgi:ABC-type oligopeptide transport system substrate-binding subunit
VIRCGPLAVEMAGLVVVLFAMQGCTGPKAGTSASQNLAAKVLRFPISEDPRSMEPGLSVLLQDSMIALNLHVGLFKYDRDSALKPYLVRDWSLSDDRLTFTFNLQDGWK